MKFFISWELVWETSISSILKTSRQELQEYAMKNRRFHLRKYRWPWLDLQWITQGRYFHHLSPLKSYNFCLKHFSISSIFFEIYLGEIKMGLCACADAGNVILFFMYRKKGRYIITFKQTDVGTTVQVWYWSILCITIIVHVKSTQYRSLNECTIIFYMSVS